MSSAAISTIIAGAGFLVSVIASAFIGGARWGSVTRQIDSLSAAQAQAATKDDMQRSNERLARIEGMFELRIRDSAP